MKNTVFKNDFLYCNWDGFSHTIRCVVGLKEKIDYDILNEAVQESKERYPYFCKRVIRKGEDYEIVFNDLPIPVSSDGSTVTFGSREADYHFISAGCRDKEIIFDVYHNLTDGKGLMEWVKTVLYLYLSKALKEDLKGDNIRLPGEDFLPGEIEDPYDLLEDKEYKAPSRIIKAETPFIFDERYTESMERRNYMIRASVSDLMRIAKSNDGSPVVVSLYFLKETLFSLYPEQKDSDILCGIPHSFREELGVINNYRSLAVELTLKCDKKFNEMPVDTQFTATRGTILVQSMKKIVKSKILDRMKFDASLDDLKTIEERRAVYKNSIEMVIDNNETMAVSYPGNIPFGSTEKHISYIHLHCSALVAPIMIEIIPLNGWFYLSIVQNRTTDIYAKKMVSLMKESGITAEYLFDYGNELCGIEFP